MAHVGMQVARGKVQLYTDHLNRKIAAEAISFKGLRDALLHEMALQALGAGQGAAAVGAALGFSDENAFARAFRRWTGQTPAQYVKSIRKQAFAPVHKAL